MPTIAAIQASLRTLADRHGTDLQSVCERGIEAANALYRHLPDASKTDSVFAQLKRSLTAIVEQSRTDARNLGAAHVLTELRAIAGSKAGGVTIPMGADPLPSETAKYIDNAVDAARAAVSEAAAEDRTEAFHATAYRAHTIIDSEVTTQYRKARDTANAYLRSLSDSQAQTYGFRVARDKADFRAADIDTRDDSKWLPLIGEKWNAVASACDKCRAADGEMRPFGFAFTLPGPSAHARCRCLRTLWAVPIPIGEDRAADDNETEPRDNDRDDRSNPRRTDRTEDDTMGDQTRDGPDTGMLRAYTPEGERAPSVNREARTVEVVVSTETVDSYDTKFIAAGLDLSRFNRNPILLSCHNSRDMKMVIGTADIRVDGKKVVATMKFLPEGKSEEADRVFDLYELKVLRGVSHGFNPLEWEDAEEDGKGRNGRVRYLRTFKRWEIVELSAVPVPSNPDALAREWREWGVSQSTTSTAATRPGKGSRVMTDKNNEMVQGELLNTLPAEIAAVLRVATVEDAVTEISKRDVRVDELTRQCETIDRAAKEAADKAVADLAAANKRADDAEKALQKRNDDDAEAYVNLLEWKTKEGKEGALVLARGNLSAFRAAHPLPKTGDAPMRHLLTQVVPTEKPGDAASVVEETRESDTSQNPIVAEKNRIQEEARAAGKEVGDADAFNRAYANVKAKLTKKTATAARDRI